ncbi:DUF4179 domain-containing protein [Paenibacillus sepulcri]|uniref:DUF4179 domain-containing protein n=1 Tax=Paenibacillus sepulcri TaxID=359917 RepID=A0ABS7C129_9BACL|nr:DUF4179 domain-containing protein [Paenibacillus sepulcri]
MSPISISDEELKARLTNMAIPGQHAAAEARIMNRIRQLPQHRLRRPMVSRFQGRVRRVVLTACLLCATYILAILAAFASPVFAQAMHKVPLLGSMLPGSILELAGDSGVKLAAGKTASRLPETVKAVDQGITFSVQDTFYDGSRIVIGYRIDTEDGRKHPESPQDTVFSVQGVRLDAGYKTKGQWLTDRTYIGVMSILPDPGTGTDSSPLADSFDLKLVIRNLYGREDGSKASRTSGRWELTVPVNQKSVGGVYLTQAAAHAGNESVTVHKVLLGASATQIELSYKGVFPAGSVIQGFRLMDDRGLIIPDLSGSGNLLESGAGEFSYLFEPLKVKPVYVIVQPYVKLQEPVEPVIVRARWNGKVPVTLSQGDAGTLTVTEIDFQTDQTLIHYQVEGSDPFMQQSSFWLETEAGERLVDGYPKRIRTADSDYSYVMAYPPLDADGIYYMGTIERQKVQILDNFSVRVPLS